MRTKQLLFVIALDILICTSLLLSGCMSGTPSPEHSQVSSSASVDVSQIEAELLKSTDAFAAKFSSLAINTGVGNTCVSPASLYYALSMVASGVQGDAQTQLLQALGAEKTSNLEEMCKLGLEDLNIDIDQCNIALADSIWVNSDFQFTDQYKKIITSDYNAEAFSVEFGIKQTDNDMSKWVNDKTKGLLSPNFKTDKNQIASLINSIYFKDAWVNQFNPDETVDDVFHTVAGDVYAPFMTAKIDGVGYADMETYTMSEMYLTSGAMMTFYLPKEGITPTDLIATPENTAALLAAEPQSYPDINYTIPKFSFSTNLRDLIPLLQKLGITDVFTNPTKDAFDTMLEYVGDAQDGNKVEGSAISDAKTANTDSQSVTPYINEVIQETNINLTEHGVEAAAYTEVGMTKMSLVDPKEPIDLVLNRPFLFKITAPNNVILFVGVMANPVS